MALRSGSYQPHGDRWGELGLAVSNGARDSRGLMAGVLLGRTLNGLACVKSAQSSDLNHEFPIVDYNRHERYIRINRHGLTNIPTDDARIDRTPSARRWPSSCLAASASQLDPQRKDNTLPAKWLAGLSSPGVTTPRDELCE